MASPTMADAIFHYMKTSENIFENTLDFINKYAIIRTIFI